MELAYQLMAPNGPYSKSQVGWALSFACGSLYVQRKRPMKDKQVVVAECQPYRTLGDFLRAAQQWVNLYNTTRPRESLDSCSPDQFAQEQQLGSVPSITLF